jgi:hypothetical protein
MSVLSNDGLSSNARRARTGPRARNPAVKFAARADSVLARYSAEEREQIVELLHILAAKAGDAETCFRRA